ncbi:MAG: AAA family ATPase [candidate division WOR-3 bacterium]
MNYESFFQMSFEPFANIPDTRFFFETNQHRMALLRLMHAADKMRGFALLVGDVGTGKTTVARKLLTYLTRNPKFQTGLIVLTHENFSEEWLFTRIAQIIGLKDTTNLMKDPMNILTRQLINLDREGKKTVILIDEANKLSDSRIVEQIRGFLNLELNDRRIITFILIGVPELERHILQNESLQQRIAARTYLKSLSREETYGYIKYRLSVVGANISSIFTPDSIDLIHSYSNGRPRLINTICDNALLEAAFLQRVPIDSMMIEEVSESLGLKKQFGNFKREL